MHVAGQMALQHEKALVRPKPVRNSAAAHPATETIAVRTERFGRSYFGTSSVLRCWTPP